MGLSVVLPGYSSHVGDRALITAPDRGPWRLSVGMVSGGVWKLERRIQGMVVVVWWYYRVGSGAQPEVLHVRLLVLWWLL